MPQRQSECLVPTRSLKLVLRAPSPSHCLPPTTQRQEDGVPRRKKPSSKCRSPCPRPSEDPPHRAENRARPWSRFGMIGGCGAEATGLRNDTAPTLGKGRYREMLPHLAAAQPVAWKLHSPGDISALAPSLHWPQGPCCWWVSTPLNSGAWANESLTDHPIRYPHFPDRKTGLAGSCQGQNLNPSPLAGWALLEGGSETWQGDIETPARSLCSRHVPDPP